MREGEREAKEFMWSSRCGSLHRRPCRAQARQDVSGAFM